MKAVPDALFLVVGDGVDLARLKSEASKLGLNSAVKFLGKVLAPDLYDIYKMGDVFVTASEIETQGIVLIEAAASGLPLVAVNAGAVSEICVDQQNGFLIDIKQEKSKSMISKLDDMISEAVVMILKDEKLRERFSVNSAKFAQEHDLKITLDKFINIYQRVLNHKVK